MACCGRFKKNKDGSANPKHLEAPKMEMADLPTWKRNSPRWKAKTNDWEELRKSRGLQNKPTSTQDDKPTNNGKP